MGHLLSFSGTDSMPAIIAADQYYRSGFAIGGSVPATEHSVMQAGSIEGEYETFLRLITEVYPTGILSIVSDTWDLWKVLTDYMPRLKDTIVARPGKIVIRPDSGDPVKIIVGDTEQMGHSGLAYGLPTHPSFYGVADLLRREFPTTKNAAGYDQLTNVGMIYGDSITLDRAKDILTGLLCKGFSPYNMVFGIGSFTYEYVTRDTYGFAMKATALKRKNQIIPIFKKPITDEGKNSKASMRGIPIVMPSDEFGFVATESIHPSDLDNCAYEKVIEMVTFLSTIPSRKLESEVRETVEAVKRADDINIIARISNPTETMNLLLLRDAIYGVNPLTEVRAILPYLPHGRAERRFCEGDCEGLNVFLNLLEGKFSKIVTLDAHKESPRYISVAVDGLIQESILSCAKASLSRNVTVILPNETSDSRYIIPSHVGTNTWGRVKVTTVNCSKKREPETGKILGFSIPLWDIDPANPVLVVDDICDGGRTFVGLGRKNTSLFEQ
ncbi:unnamed protein product [Sphagnum tenellum]